MSDKPNAATQHWRLPGRVAYVVSHSLPWSSNGYAVRTHAVARALTEAGHEVIVFTRPGRPWDIEGFDAQTPVQLDQKIDGVRYVCLPLPPLPGAHTTARSRAMADVLTEALQVFRPAAVLAASNWETAEPARRAASQIGAAFYYEQRGFWEMGANAATKEAEARRETEIALDARAVFTLNGLMRDELVRRGVPPGRIHLVPNGLAPLQKISKRITRSDVGCHSKYLLGYIGSLSAYEGLDTLLELVALLRRGDDGAPGLDVDALIVGSDAPKGMITGPTANIGPAEAALRAQAAQLGIAAHVHFVPQMPEEVIGGYYTICDAMVMPRKRNSVTELVPPIKPYAAAAFSLPVFMTDLPPLAEIATEIHGNVFPEGDVTTLAAMVRAALTQGHPASIAVLDPDLDWSRRIQPMSDHLKAVAAAEQARNAQIFGTTFSADPSVQQTKPPVTRSFDIRALPQVGLQGLLDATNEARIGPSGGNDALGVTRLTRSNLLEVLATANPGVFVIDWAGLQAQAGFADSEWAGLWSIDDMRLNRQIMDATRIALDRGWRIQVIGPVHRSQAPLFRTVASVVQEILPEPLAQGAAQ